MSSNFSLGRRRDSLDGLSDIQSGSRYDNVNVLAIAANDPFWTSGEIPESGIPETPDAPDAPEPENGSDSNPDGSGDNDDRSGNGLFSKQSGGRFGWLKRLSRKQWLIIASVAIVLLAGGAAGALALHHKPAPKASPVIKTTVKKAAPVAPPAKPKSGLTGLEVSEEDSKRPVIGVMIENTPWARPQSGLMEAGIVYEAIAEAGITRFLALYQEADPANIGPVRSARPYYVDWAHSYDAAYGHVGGSPDALDKIKGDSSIRDMDQFYNSGAYHRISSREAPHNMYTNGDSLRQLVAGKGWTSSSFTGLLRKAEAKAATPTATGISLSISGADYNVHYDYDGATNSYMRSEGGEAHKDAESGKQLAPKVVIAMAAQYGLMADGYHSEYLTTGTGNAKIFQDGTVTDTTWKRDTATSQYSFTDTNGKTVALDPGQTWITMVADPSAVNYQ